MKKSNTLGGLGAVLKRLESKVSNIADGTKSGLIAAGLFVQARAQDNTPVDTGNLRASAKTSWEGEGLNTRVVVGYTGAYAIFVHERKANHETGDWKFLERAVTENMGDILQIIQKHSQL